MSVEAREDVAAVGFAAALTAMLGPVGLFIAAVAVGVERAWNGSAGADHARESARQNRADHRAWLERDKAERVAWRQARRDWWKAGADPATRPARPSKPRRFGRWFRRLWARTVVAADDFRDGYRDKREQQRHEQEGKREGAEHEERAGGRDLPDGGPEPRDRGGSEEHPANEKQPLPPPDRIPGPQEEEEPMSPQRDAAREGFAMFGRCRHPYDGGPNGMCGEPVCEDPHDGGRPGNPYCRYHTVATGTSSVHGPPVYGSDPTRPTPEYRPRHGANNSDTEPTDEGDDVETNLDLTINDLTKVRTGMEGIDAEVDRVAAIVTAALERMMAKGGTDATKAALDAAMAACATLSQATATAIDEVTAAREGLRPAEQAQDDLHSAGATGELVSAAAE